MKKLITFGLSLSMLFLLGSSVHVHAQLSKPIPPKTSDPSVRASFDSEVSKVTMPVLDLTFVKAEDLINDLDDSQPWRFAVPHKVELTLENSGQWENVPGGGRVWRLEIVSPGAVSLNLLYREFFLPEGAIFHIYQPGRGQMRGAFTSDNNKSDRVFATALIKGESIVLEYFEPEKVEGEGVINISTINHGYRGYGENNAATGNSGNCQNDVNCSGNATWQTIKRAVGKWTRNGSTWCTGTLLNNTNLDCRPLFLTANHCIDGSTALGWDAISNNGPFNTQIFYWNFETPGCNQGEQGDDTQTTNGVQTVLANPFLNGSVTSSSDFALLELNENPKSAYNVYFAGWDASGATSTDCAGIHHPSGDVKKISISSPAPVNSPASSNYWRILPWDEFNGNRGVTEGGSSGSGLFRSNGRLIGQLFGALSGGNPNCSDPVNDRGDYGKLSYSWTNSAAADSRRRLNVHLDPVGSGATTVLSGSPNPCGMPSNVVCANAIPLGCGDSHTVNTTYATADGNPGSCGASLLGNEPGVWYLFTGNNREVTVSTCNGTTDFDTKLLVFSSSCGSLTCVDGNDDFGCGNNESQVIFDANTGTDYYIYLAGFLGAVGTAQVDVTCCDLPDANCMNALVNLNGTGNGSISTADVDDNSDVDCGLGSINVNPSLFTCSNLGPNTVTLTATDRFGNSDNCTATVTVQDLASPVALCKDITMYLDQNLQAVVSPDSVDNGSSDNCNIDSMHVARDSFDCSDLGQHVVVLTVIDQSDNQDTCHATVSIENDPNQNLCCLDGETDNNHIAQLSEYMSGTFNPSGDDNGFGDYTNIMIPIMSPYYQYLYFLFTPGGIPDLQNWELYIDWNDNLLFEPSEKMMDYCTAGPFARFMNLAPYPNGLHRMRLIMQVDTDNDGCQPGELPDPLCGSIGEGEVEDYMLCKFCVPPSKVADPSILAEEIVQAFPNPFSDELIVLFPHATEGEKSWELRDVNGRIVRQGKESDDNNQIQLRTSDLASGLYVLRVETARGVVSKSVVKP